MGRREEGSEGDKETRSEKRNASVPSSADNIYTHTNTHKCLPFALFLPPSLISSLPLPALTFLAFLFLLPSPAAPTVPPPPVVVVVVVVASAVVPVVAVPTVVVVPAVVATAAVERGGGREGR